MIKHQICPKSGRLAAEGGLEDLDPEVWGVEPCWKLDRRDELGEAVRCHIQAETEMEAQTRGIDAGGLRNEAMDLNSGHPGERSVAAYELMRDLAQEGTDRATVEAGG